MTDVPYPNDFDRLVANIRTEIDAQMAMSQVELDESVIQHLAEGIASSIDYAFEFHWRPRWVKSGDAHHWNEDSESGQQYFVECLRCTRITRHPSALEGDAWYVQHCREHA